MRVPLLLLLVLTTGCASAPSVHHPGIGVPIPTEWSSASDPGPAQPLWWRQFGDPALEAIVAEALEANRDLRAAAARVDAAAALARVAGADEWPVANAGFDASRRKENFIGLPIPGAEGQVLSTRTTAYGVSLDASCASAPARR